MFRRAHLELDDAHLMRMLDLSRRQVGEHRLPDGVQSMTPRELLSTLMEIRDAGEIDVPPLVVRQPLGVPRVDCLAVTEVMEFLCQDGSNGEAPDARGTRWHPRPDPRARLTTSTVLSLLEMMDVIEDLSRNDKAMLTIQALQRTTERWMFSPVDGRTTPITRRQVGRTLILAIDGVVRAVGASREDWFATMKRYCRAYTLWTVEMISLLEKRVHGGELSEEDKVRLSWYVHARSTIGPRRDWGQFRRAVARAMRQLGLRVTPLEVREYLGAYKNLTEGSCPGIFTTSDGRVLLGERQFRDRASSAWGLPRHRDAKWKVDPEAPPTNADEVLSDSATERRGVDPDFADASDALSAVEAADTLRRLRVILERRLSEKRPGSTRHLVLQHFESLHGGLSARALSESSGRSHGKISKALREITAEIAAELEDS